MAQRIVSINGLRRLPKRVLNYRLRLLSELFAKDNKVAAKGRNETMRNIGQLMPKEMHGLLYNFEVIAMVLLRANYQNLTGRIAEKSSRTTICGTPLTSLKCKDNSGSIEGHSLCVRVFYATTF